MSELETLTGLSRQAGLKHAAAVEAARQYFQARAALEQAVRTVGMRLTAGMDGVPSKLVFKAADFPVGSDEPGLGDIDGAAV